MGPHTPTKLGRYEIVDEIGKGAMGIVYLARDPLIGRLVALKTFRIGYSVKDQDAEQFRIRFLREAQSAGILTHPNIVTIHDVVEASDEGLAFIAMEYVRGTNLKLVLQGEKPLTFQFVLDLVSQVGEALDYAHAHRVIHRDVKPANILITDDGRMKLTDFGIARLDTSNLTQEGQLLGTPNYMAPEQIQGREVDHRADLFSLGVVLYEMLTRHKPFQGENLTVVSHRIVYDPFTPPREYARELPLGVEQVLTRALDKDPARRYQRGRDLVEELRRILGARSAATLPAAPPPLPPLPGSESSALNDTQSLSSTMVHPPSDLHLAETTGSRSGSRWVPPPPPIPAPDLPSLDDTAALAPPATSGAAGAVGAAGVAGKGGAATAKGTTGSRGTGSVGRWIGWLAVLAVVAVVGGAAYRLASGWRSPAPLPPSAVPPVSEQERLDGLVREAQQHLQQGDYAGAVDVLRRAEALAPDNAVIRGMRESSERTSQFLASAKTQGEQLEAQLEIARQAFAAKHFPEAAAAATAALKISPGQAEASDLLGRSNAALALARRRQQKPVPGSKEVAGEELASVPAARPAEPEPAAPASEVKDATLVVSLYSQFPRGTVMVYVNNEKVLTEPFRFVERGGLFRSRTAPGEMRRTVTVKPGTAQIRVYVTPEGKAAQVKSFSGNFLGDSSRTLEIRLSEAGDVAANLN